MEFMTIYQFNSELESIQAEVNALKKELIAGLIVGNKDLETWKIDMFKASLKARLFKIKEYGDRLGKQIRSTRAEKNDRIETIQYDLIKELIFDHPDYRSTVGYMIGLLSGIAAGELKKSSDINDYFAHTIEQAYHLNVETTGELIEKCQFMLDNREPMSKLDKKLFNSLSGYPDLFRMTDASTIFTNVVKSLDGLVKHYIDQPRKSATGGLIDISAIGSYFDYLTFTVLAYVSRTFLIGYYFAAIWQGHNAKNNVVTPVAMSESAELDDVPGAAQFTPLIDFDRSKVLDPASLMQFLHLYGQLVVRFGAGQAAGIPKDITNEYGWEENSTLSAMKRIISDTGLSDNIIVAKVLGRGNCYYYSTSELRSENPVNITEMYHNLKSSVTNSKQALQSNISAKDDILRVIGSDYGIKTLADLRNKAADSFIMTGSILIELKRQLQRITGTTLDSSMTGDATLGNSKLLAECHMMLLELYHDIATASYTRALTLDRLFVRLSAKESDAMIKSTEIDTDKLISAGMIVQVPDTLRGSDELLSQYQRPLLESYLLQNEFLRSIDEFTDDPYLTEAGGADLISAIMSLVEGIVASIAGFMKNFKPAAAWVKKNVDPETMTFADDAKLSGIYLYDIRDYSKALSGLKLESIKANFDKSDEEFAASLYGTADVYKMFKSDKAKAAIAWKNARLFNVTKADALQGTATVTGKDIKVKLAEWVADVNAGDGIMADLTNTANEMKEVVKYLKAEAVKPSAEPTTSTAPAATAAPEIKLSEGEAKAVNKAAGTDAAANKPASAEKPTTTASTEKAAAPTGDSRIIRVQNAINNLWLPIYQGVIKSLRDEYGYIRQAIKLTQSAPAETNDTTAKPSAADGV